LRAAISLVSPSSILPLVNHHFNFFIVVSGDIPSSFRSEIFAIASISCLETFLVSKIRSQLALSTIPPAE